MAFTAAVAWLRRNQGEDDVGLSVKFDCATRSVRSHQFAEDIAFKAVALAMSFA